MSVQLVYNASKSPSGLDYGTRNGTINLRQPIYLDANKRKSFRVLKVAMSPVIPNIYNFNGFNNTTLKISKNNGVNWTDVLFDNGVYTVNQLSEGINNVASQLSWWANSSEPGFTLSYNIVTQYIYIKLDSTKLNAVGQLCIDFGTSSIYSTLGYLQTACSFNTNGIHSATLAPELDSQSTSVDIYVSCIQGTRYVNGNLSNSVLHLPIVDSATEIIFPSNSTGIVSSFIPASIPSAISAFDVKIINGRGRDAVFLFGNFYIEVEIIDN